ncbi:uncharacterized protein LOC123556945 [Mercenaria mercenaria]|uniref:uncharacterized protein LOC123556945 n=1 Tax=Mercenaria mercenaria TaxID=6596 RepID=UPI00234F355B|nr:uncharacterized protein LOC123556945 [Mercenaria mercenaria]
MELEGAIGRRVKILLEDGTNIDGFVHSLSANSGKISLEKVDCFENGRKKKLVGLQHYFAEEITSIVVTEDVCKHKKKTKSQESVLPIAANMTSALAVRGLLMLGNSHVHKLYGKCFLICYILALTSSGNETGSSDSDIDALPQSDEYTIIPKLCNTFYESVTYIKKHQVVAVAMEGISIGRFGRLCWLQIAVPGHVFMFDVLQMGRACFEEGVKSILESEDILKVLHDCRMVSDLLHHQYDINIINVFDTQVANVFVYRLRHHHDWPRYVDGLGSALVQHLDLSMEEVNWAVVRERRREEDEEVWRERPPQRHLVEAAVKNVKHLIELRMVLMEKMMEEFVAGVNIYLMHVRDASDNDAKRYQTTPHLLPVAFQDIRAFMSSYRGQNPHFNVREVPKDMNGFRENCSGIVQPDVYFSKDSIWHGGSKKTGIKGPRSISSVMNSQVSSQGSCAASADKQSATESQESSSVSTHKHNTSQSDIDSIHRNKTDIPTQRLIHTSTESGNDSIQSCETVIPSRRNIHTSPDSDLVSKAVAAMNAKKLEMEGEISQSEFCETKFNPQNIRNLDAFGETSIATKDLNAAELRGGSLMRALVHEQDATGFEATADIENFTILPAGKMVSVAKKTKVVSSGDLNDSVMHREKSASRSMPHSVGCTQGVCVRNGKISPEHSQPVSRSQREELRPAIPGGDIATYSPPRKSRLTEQELLMLERLQNSQLGRMHEQDVLDMQKHKSSSDNDTPSHRPSSQGARKSNRLIEQLQGKSSTHFYSSDSGNLASFPRQMKDSHNSTSDLGHFNGYGSSASEKDGPHLSSVPSETNAKLKSLFQKLKQQSE